MALRDPYPRHSSKPLRTSSHSTTDFNRAVLADDPTYGIDIDTLYRHPTYGLCYFEYCRFQVKKQHISIEQAGPNNYWRPKRLPDGTWKAGHSGKYRALWALVQAHHGHLIIVNFVSIDDDPDHHFPVCVIHPLVMDNAKGFIQEQRWITTFDRFSDWLRGFNAECNQPHFPDITDYVPTPIPFPENYHLAPSYRIPPPESHSTSR